MTYGRALESQARRCQERQSLMVRPPGGQGRCRWSNRGTSCHRNQGLEGGFQAREPDTHTAWPLHFYRRGSDFPEAKSKVSSATVRAALTWPRTLFPSGFIPADSCLAHHVLTLNALYQFRLQSVHRTWMPSEGLTSFKYLYAPCFPPQPRSHDEILNSKVMVLESEWAFGRWG